MAMAYCLKKGECKKEDMSDKVIKLADSMTLNQLKDYASTKEYNLPVKKENVHIKTYKEFLNEGKQRFDESNN